MQFPEVINQLTRLAAPSQPLYLVGGAVRDLLLGKPCSDFDFVSAHDPRALARTFANENNGDFFMLDEERDTCRVLINTAVVHDLVVDFAVMRGDNILEDLAKRDFTINAMALDLRDPDLIIDPFKGGKDLLEKRLRVVSPASFMDDPLRTIRAVRYALGLGLNLAPGMPDLIRAAVSGLGSVSAERKRDELFKIFSGHKVHAALQLLKQLEVLPYIPLAIAQDFTTLVTRSRSLEDVLEWLCGAKVHEQQAAFYQSSLLVELGRFREDLQRFYLVKNQSRRDRRSLLFLATILDDAAGLERDLRLLALSVVEIQQVRDLQAAFPMLKRLIARGSVPEPLDIYRYFKTAASGGVDGMVTILADYASRVGSEFSQAQWLFLLKFAGNLMQAWFRTPQLIAPVPLVNGDTLMRRFSLSPGPHIGELLEQLKEEQIKGSVTNESEALLWIESVLMN